MDNEIANTDHLTTLSISSSDWSDEEKTKVKSFCLRLKTIFGTGKYSAMFGHTPESEKGVMVEWGPMICLQDNRSLNDCLDYAKEGITSDTFICIPDILRGRPQCKMHQAMPDDQLMIPRSVTAPKQKKLDHRDTHGYRINDRLDKCEVVSRGEIERRRQAIIDRIEKKLKSSRI